jgi:ADP-ribose pyrophosphatase YjhB (NUDIX family)
MVTPHEISCDHTSVGILVYRAGKLLLIERKKPPFGFAPPAGHLDGRSYEEAAVAELYEEVGLKAGKLELVAEGRKENQCRRIGGDWHEWKIYLAHATGAIKPQALEVKSYIWCGPAKLGILADRTRAFNSGQISSESWRGEPGLEPVWLEWLTTIRVIR